MRLRQSPIVQSLYYTLRIDVLKNIFSKQWKTDVETAIQTYMSSQEREDKKLVEFIRKDILKCYCSCKSKPYEYFLFGLRYCDLRKRKTFITDTSIYVC